MNEVVARAFSPTDITIPVFASPRRMGDPSQSMASTDFVPELMKRLVRHRMTIREIRDEFGMPEKRTDEWVHALYESGILEREDRPGTGTGNGPKAKEYWLSAAFGGEA